jgi:sugar-specific transcriptional regulator TrmB
LKKEDNIELKESFNLDWRELRICLDLSECEAKAYLSLIQNGALKASNLSIIAGIPRTKVYLVIRKLLNSGLVSEIPGTPLKFTPSSPMKAFRNHLTENKEKTDRLYYIVSCLENIFKKNKDNGDNEKGTIWIIQGMNRILEKINEMLFKAEENVIIITDENRSILIYQNFRILIGKLKEKLVHIKLMTQYGNTNRYVLKQLENPCKVIDSNISLPIIYINVDNTHFLLAIMTPKTIDLNLKAEIAFFAQNQTLAKFFNFLLRTQIDG